MTAKRCRKPTSTASWRLRWSSKLQFGRRVLPLRDLVELAAGSVIELDKRAQEPASLLLGGKVIARGEVVLSEGNYALRVTEICDRASSVWRAFKEERVTHEISGLITAENCRSHAAAEMRASGIAAET